jgi:hypothetical protein
MEWHTLAVGLEKCLKQWLDRARVYGKFWISESVPLEEHQRVTVCTRSLFNNALSGTQTI